MVFFEIVLGKLFLLGLLAVVGRSATPLSRTCRLADDKALRALSLAVAVAAGAGSTVLANLMLATALALLVKLLVYQLYASVGSRHAVGESGQASRRA